MGHYERLLLRHLDGPAAQRRFALDTLYDGRRAGPRTARSLGLSTTRLGGLPWPVARAVVRLREGAVGADLYHSLALTFPPPSGKRYLLTIHDLPPLRFGDEGTLPGWSASAARSALAIVTPSQFGKREIVELLDARPERVHVVPNGCIHDVFHPGVIPASTAELDALGLRRPFLLYAGGSSRRKNVPAMLEAWKTLADAHPDTSLAMAGPIEGLAPLVARAEGPRVRVLGYQAHEALVRVMKAAEALVMPSVYEGFGLPALEAMALGLPVVAVRAGAVPEVVGRAGVLCPDGTPAQLAAGMRRVLDDDGLRVRLAAEGPRQAQRFTWESHVAQVLEIYDEALP